VKLLYLLLFVLFLSGCGYSVPGQSGSVPAGVEKIFIPLFVNNTSKPLLENELTNRVSEVFSRNIYIEQVNKQEQSEAILKGVIGSYSSRAISYNSNDDIGEYRATMTVAVALIAKDAVEPLWKRNFSWGSTYLAAEDKGLQDDLEHDAIDEISRRLAEEILHSLLDDF